MIEIMHIAQISDSHVKKKGTLLFGKVDTYGLLEAAVERIERLDPLPDILLHTGDLANDGEPGDYVAIAELLGRFSMPVLPILGNHDRREPARAALSFLPHVPESGCFRYVVEDYPVRIVALDTLVEGKAGGKLGSEQLRWLDATLAARPEVPTLVMLHHPPFATGISYMDSIGLADAAAFSAVISQHGQIMRIVAGHVHRPISTCFAGTVAMTAPGTAHQIGFNLSADDEAPWTLEPPGFLVHRFEGGALVSHTAGIAAHAWHSYNADHSTAET